MVPGRDIPFLQERYTVTGSDISDIFLRRYREQNPDADLLNLDAVTLQTERKFDCIFSNKVLHYLSGPELKTSLQRQARILNPGGIVCHTFWYGDKQIEVKGMTFYYYNEKTILDQFGEWFTPIRLVKYWEMDTDDSMLVMLKKHQGVDNYP